MDGPTRAVGREKEGDLLGLHEQRIDVELAATVVLDRDRERVRVVPVDDAAHDVCGAIAEEQARQHLDLVVRLEAERSREALPECCENISQVAPEVGKAAIEPEIENDVDQGMT